MPEEKETPETQPSLTSPSTTSGVRDQRTQPPGVVAKQSQSYLIAGLSMVILLAVLFSKNHAKPVAKPLQTAAVAPTTEASQRNVERFEDDLTAEQRQVEAQRQAAASTNLPPGEQNGTARAANTQRPLDNQPPRDPIADAEKALAFKSRFASNLVTPQVTRSHDNTARSPWEQNPGAGLGNTVAPASLQSQPMPGSMPNAAPNTKQTSAAIKRPPEVNLNAAACRRAPTCRCSAVRSSWKRSISRWLASVDGAVDAGASGFATGLAWFFENSTASRITTDSPAIR